MGSMPSSSAAMFICALGDEERLRRAEAAHGAGRRLVGVDVVAPVAVGGVAVEHGAEVADEERGGGPHGVVGAAVEVDLQVLGHQRAVLRVKPTRERSVMGWRRRPAASSSSRVRVNFTGRPVRRARKAAQTSHERSSILPPKPPPTAGLITRTSFSRSPSAEASRHWTMYGVCVEVHSVTRPSGSACARLEHGSR